MKFHGFDDSGSRYNAEGNLVDWWTAEDSKQFSALTTAATQYSALEPLPGTLLMVNLLWEKTLVI
jgi:endothelin-converting enzyme/putative endopeptidase